MNIYKNIPYTYYIKWSSTGMKYYGVRYAKNCNPYDLWSTYFTSSRYVKEYVSIYGDPDIIEIRKQFTGPDKINEAREWEFKVLKRLDVINRKDYLNKSIGKGIPPMPGELNPMKIEKNKQKHKNVVSSVEHKNKLKAILNSDEQRFKNSERQKISQNKQSVKESKSTKMTELFQDPILKKKHKDSCNTQSFKDAASNKLKETVWLNNGIEQKYIKLVDAMNYINSGWVFGMLDQSHNSNKRLMNNGQIAKMTHPDNFESLLSSGWVFGMLPKLKL